MFIIIADNDAECRGVRRVVFMWVESEVLYGVIDVNQDNLLLTTRMRSPTVPVPSVS